MLFLGLKLKKSKNKNRGRGRPRTVNPPARIASLVEKLKAYIEDPKNLVPIIQEFCFLNDVSRDTLYDNPEFSMLLKKLIAKKESMLEKLALQNKINVSQAIFSLKQLGWRDRFDHELRAGKEEAIDQELKKIAEAMMK